MPNAHDELRAQLERGWIENTDCSPLAAELAAEEELGIMHQSENCPVCHPPCADCGRMWHSCTCGDAPDNRPTHTND